MGRGVLWRGLYAKSQCFRSSAALRCKLPRLRRSVRPGAEEEPLVLANVYTPRSGWWSRRMGMSALLMAFLSMMTVVYALVALATVNVWRPVSRGEGRLEDRPERVVYETAGTTRK